ncbi:unnamed protein product [Camellia sinensis]
MGLKFVCDGFASAVLTSNSINVTSGVVGILNLWFRDHLGGGEDFEEHAEKAKTLPESTTNESKLILYGLYKQATVGPINTSRPGMFNMRDRAKWDAWKAVEGKSKDEAMSDYITKVKQLLEEATASA